jgi:hypothetical protein
MGIIRQGIFGGFEKRTGGLVGRRMRGRSLISAPQHKSAKGRSQAQLDQQLKFELVLTFLSRFRHLIANGFRHAAGKGNAFNAAVKYNFRNNIIIGASPDYVIDYPKLVYSRGSLAGPNAPMVSLGVNMLTVTWLPEAQSQFNRYLDKANFLVYCPDKKMALVYPDRTFRSSLGYNLPLPVNLGGFPLHVYMSFISVDGREVSNSEYLGLV